MGLKGKLIRKEGTYVIFGSKNKPEWKPIEISGRVDPGGMVPGNYYEIDLDDNRLVAYTKLESRASSGGEQSSSGPTAPRSMVGRESLMISATGFAKSAMEGGVVKSVGEAISAGLAWADVWGDAPMDPRVDRQRDEGRQDGDRPRDPDW